MSEGFTLEKDLKRNISVTSQFSPHCSFQHEESNETGLHQSPSERPGLGQGCLCSHRSPCQQLHVLGKARTAAVKFAMIVDVKVSREARQLQ